MDFKITGSVFYAYQVCKREAWFYYHHINPSKDHPLLTLGRLIHQHSYKRLKKEIFIDQLLKIDVIKNKAVAEVKKSSKFKKGAMLQLAFYLYYLKKEKGLILKGALLFPKERKKEEIELTPDLEKEVEKLIEEMVEVLNAPYPPEKIQQRACKVCSFQEVCWG